MFDNSQKRIIAKHHDAAVTQTLDLQSKDICVELEEIPSFLKYCVREYSTDKLTT